MSFEQDVKMISLEAEGDISANQYRFVKLGVNGVNLNTVAGGPCTGVLQNKPSVANNVAAVAYNGVSKVVAGAAVVRGANIQSDATGRAITAAAVDYSQGEALEAAGAAGDIIAVLLKPNAQLN